ncbi:MAG: bis(5'-nucleosyl)-tetraphosphatase (symmetrical) YqeK [Endomicrobium sp.]|jgi:predicted HD superfamily hydrolase involved in NAD metabolism|nr:bis(5'-nucleosyl)-tetraphosphatase (symmetrical) YqeK [Endomicrobium sp.]
MKYKRINIEEIIKYLYINLNKNKFKHSIDTSIIASNIALKNNCDIFKVKIASLLHDCSKFMTHEELVFFLKKFSNYSLKKIENMYKFSPYLLHSCVSEIIAKKKFNVSDVNILNAIKNHTVCRKNMTDIEKIVFISDYISHYKNEYLEIIFNFFDYKLNDIFLNIFSKKIKNIVENLKCLSEQSINVWNWYVLKDKKIEKH